MACNDLPKMETCVFVSVSHLSSSSLELFELSMRDWYDPMCQTWPTWAEMWKNKTEITFQCMSARLQFSKLRIRACESVEIYKKHVYLLDSIQNPWIHIIQLNSWIHLIQYEICQFTKTQKTIGSFT